MRMSLFLIIIASHFYLHFHIASCVIYLVPDVNRFERFLSITVSELPHKRQAEVNKYNWTREMVFGGKLWQQ